MNTANTIVRNSPIIDGNTPQLFLGRVTPEVASYWLENYRYPGQRIRREHHIKELADAIRANEFEENLVAFRVHNGVTYQVNATHTCCAIIEADAVIELPVSTKVVPFYEDVEAAYSRYDIQLRRSYHDVAPYDRICESTKLKKGDVTYTAQAAPFVLSGFDQGVRWKERNATGTWTARTKFVEDWAPEAELYFAAIQQSSGRLASALRRAPMVAVGLVLLHGCKDLARSFFEDVATDNALAKHSPEQMLVKGLENAALYKEMGPFGFCRFVARCWNAYVDGSEMKSFRAGKDPIRLAGTPYTVK